MPQVRLSACAVSDFARLYQFLTVQDTAAAKRAMRSIREAFALLKRFPMIRRPADDNTYLRKLIIDFGASGYLVLHHFGVNLYVVTILAIKHQRENDYQ